MPQAHAPSQTLSVRQRALIPVAALGAAGDMPQLSTALDQGLSTGLTVSEAKEVLVQLYAYAGFPRSLNALSELMKVLEDRRQRGIVDAQGLAPHRAIPKGDALLAAGTANQTQVIGSPVTGALFDFAPAIDEFLKTHLFGDIFERDNLDWPSRELATVAMLSVLQGAESQLRAHIGSSMNVGITAEQLALLAEVLAERVDAASAARARAALSSHLASGAAR
jgi:alkylhydroperoxidase/carboxymuconolactone decarboxylase family protein YurZ